MVNRMNRRSSSMDSYVEAVARTVSLDLPFATVLPNPKQEWTRVASGPGRMRLAHQMNVDWKKFTTDKYLFSHCSIVASIDTEKNGYWIKPACGELVNSNGNAWTNNVLLATFKSFIGGENYLEHVQVPELSKGKLLDAVLRPLEYVDSKGQKANIYYCDILVATDRKHKDLVKKIASGELTTMSMGCTCDFVQCSHCGRVFGDGQDNCYHLDHELGGKFVDKNGVLRVTAELCGRSIVGPDGNMVGDPKSVTFIEASWVEHPAFTGAVLNHYVSDISDLKKASKYASWTTKKLEFAVEDIFKMRVADRNGMLCLRVAQHEVARRMREDRISKIVGRMV
jgi:hypothetical protein